MSKLSSGEINSSKKKMSKQEQNLKNFIKKNPKRAALTSGLGLPTLNHPRNSPGSSGDSACGTHRQLVLPIRDGAALPRNPWIRAFPIPTRVPCRGIPVLTGTRETPARPTPLTWAAIQGGMDPSWGRGIRGKVQGKMEESWRGGKLPQLLECV